MFATHRYEMKLNAMSKQANEIKGPKYINVKYKISSSHLLVYFSLNLKPKEP